jgi:hypothetical protein
MIFNYLFLVIYRLELINSYSSDFFVVLNILSIVPIACTVLFAVLSAITLFICFILMFQSIILSVFLNSFYFNKVCLKVFLSIIILAIEVTFLNIFILTCTFIETIVWELLSKWILNDLVKLIWNTLILLIGNGIILILQILIYNSVLISHALNDFNLAFFIILIHFIVSNEWLIISVAWTATFYSNSLCISTNQFLVLYSALTSYLLQVFVVFLLIYQLGFLVLNIYILFILKVKKIFSLLHFI